MKNGTSEFEPVKSIGDQIVGDQIPLLGVIRVRVFRADGRIEEKELKNVVTRSGLNRIANRAVQATGTSPFYILGVGTATATHSLDSVQAGVGEVLRKTSAFTGANAQSREWIFAQCTIGGASDSVTSVPLDTVFMADFPNSHASTGIIGGVTNGLGVTLAGSDLLDLTYRFRVGSHNLSHST
jgi:hypothetical protein